MSAEQSQADTLPRYRGTEQTVGSIDEMLANLKLGEGSESNEEVNDDG